MAAMKLKVQEHGDVTVVYLGGDVEVHEIDGLREVMEKPLNGKGTPKAVLDLSGVTRMTSYVVALVGYYNAQFKQSGGQLIVTGASQGGAQRPFELSGLVEVITMADTVEAAIRNLQAPSKGGRA
jgi:anti-anti-sigma factor